MHYIQVLIDWINNELEEERIIVKDLEEDVYDGQVLQKLFGKKTERVDSGRQVMIKHSDSDVDYFSVCVFYFEQRSCQDVSLM